jgi:hypothetical protein
MWYAPVTVTGYLAAYTAYTYSEDKAIRQRVKQVRDFDPLA